jgi:serine protease 12 (motopsin)
LSLRVVVGDQNNIHPDPTEKVNTVQKVFIHSKYVRETHENDIALIKLTHPVDTSSSYIKPACLPTFGDDEFNSSSNCYVTGWGETLKGT